VVALGGEVYVVGGFTPQGVVPTVEIYDPSANAWRSGADFPDPAVHHANAAAAGGRLWVTGYLVSLQFTTVGRVFSYDPNADAWTEHDPMPTATERGASAVAVVDAAIYVLGGLRSGAPVADAWRFETATEQWTPLPDLPSARDHLVAAAVDGKVYAIGGRGGAISSHTPRVDVFDPAAGAWSEGPPLPTSRAGMAAAAVGSFVFVAGGEGNPDAASGVFAAFEVLDTTTGTWMVLDPMPAPRHGTGAAAVGATVYIPGGADQEAFAAVDTVEAWTLQAGG
jgi:N-acetylneuraminic acid mutarotase